MASLAIQKNILILKIVCDDSDGPTNTIYSLIKLIFTSMQFYFFFLAFFLPLPLPDRFRFTDFGERSFAFPFAAVVEFPFVRDFLIGIFSLLRRSAPNLPFARSCCCTKSLKAPSCASIVKNVVMNSS